MQYLRFKYHTYVVNIFLSFKLVIAKYNFIAKYKDIIIFNL